jgi:serine palmitoyltransferase
LGFGQNSGAIIDSVCDTIDRYSFACASPLNEGGNYELTQDLERAIARFVGKQAATVIGMGFATNSTTLPIICGGKGTLIVSDMLNHNSIVTGSRDSGARIVPFRHNDMRHLEEVLRRAIIDGQPRTHRPWKRIFIVIEGIYSMEGEMPHLAEVVRLKKKYRCYLYVDEAHSIGALGAHGRGVCEQTGVDPADVDILMGTFTKAFGSVGGYIAGDTEFIEMLRHRSHGTTYATSFSPPCVQQALGALRVISGEDGTDEGQQRIKRLHENSNYFRKRLEEEGGLSEGRYGNNTNTKAYMLSFPGFHMFGDYYSPVVLMMTYHVSVMLALSQAMLQEGVAIVVVGFPVTPLLLSRIRFCISASHTIEQLERAVKVFSEVGEIINVKYAKSAKYITYTQHQKKD